MTDDTVKKRKIEPRAIEISDLDMVMTTESGRRVISRILAYSGVELDTFDENPLLSARKSGKRAVGLWLMRELKDASMDKYYRMLIENEQENSDE